LKKPIQPDGLFHALGQTHYGLREQSEAATPLWLAHFFSREAAKMRREHEGHTTQLKIRDFQSKRLAKL
tara:strand:+ start:911 stop:1117 length:207 start_codon:yes stop_codon:yes gene_type:complete